MCLRPMVRSFVKASFSFVTEERVMEISSGTIGSSDRAKVIWIGPRTWPQLTSVDITAPKVRMSKKLSHIHLVNSCAFAGSFGSFLGSTGRSRAE
jgi:hypothetical protein